MSKIEKQRESLDYIIRNRQIRTVFQPIISLKSGAVLGYEALSRITCESEFESPEILFTAAKAHNRLWDLEQLCRTTALEAAQKFISSPDNKKLFINVNPNVMHDESFRKGFTKDFLKQYRISPNNIIFEITERNVIDDMAGFKSTISHYKIQDYKIAIDDAGAGYSGLNLISDVNPNYIKLDMQLIRNINADSLRNALVKGMVEFSKASNVKLIAEGVETYEELKTIIDLGVQYAQGYYIQRPDAETREIRPEIAASICEINMKKDRLARNDIFHTAVQCLCDDAGTIPSSEPVLRVYDIMKQDPHAFGLCVVDNGIPTGIITKEKLALALSGQYGFALHKNKSIATIMDRHFLSVDHETPVNVVSALAMARTNSRLYDFIVVTEGSKYLGTVTIKSLLQKSSEIEVSVAKQQNPLTGLPGNLIIEQKINDCIQNTHKFSILYLDIDNFKAYNDVYGFENGDLVIKLLADVLRRLIPHDQFIGHIGGDDFVAVFDDHKTSDDFRDIIQQFEAEVLALYDQTDLQNNYITAKNRYGTVERFPLITLTAVVVNNASRVYASSFELSEELAGLKNREKQRKADRRPGRDGRRRETPPPASGTGI